jgi:hypothetical protein
MILRRRNLFVVIGAVALVVTIVETGLSDTGE